MATPGLGVRTTRDYVRTVTGSWSENVGSWTARPHPAVLVVRYEDLIADPKKHFGAVARHLLMAPTEDQLDKAIEMTGFERLRAEGGRRPVSPSGRTPPASSSAPARPGSGATSSARSRSRGSSRPTSP